MTFTTPKTWAVGDVLTAADMNTYVRSNAAWLGTDKPSARVYHNTTQSIASGSYTALVFNSELYDGAGMHSTVSNTGRLTVPAGAGGVYSIGGCVELDDSAGNPVRRGIQIRVNGATVIARDEADRNPSNDAPLAISTEYFLAGAGTSYVELMVMQNSGVSINALASGGYSPHFWAHWVSTS